MEDTISSLDYTLKVLSDGGRGALSTSEVVEMQIMDEGLVRWRDDILELITNKQQVKALARLDSLINRARPYYMVNAPKPLSPFTGFRDPNAAAVTNAWADLIGDKKPVSTEEAVTSVWESLFDDVSDDVMPPIPEAARPAETGATPADELVNGEPTTSAKMDNVMTIGGIQLDLGAAQADRLSASGGGANARGRDPP